MEYNINSHDYKMGVLLGHVGMGAFIVFVHIVTGGGIYFWPVVLFTMMYSLIKSVWRAHNYKGNIPDIEDVLRRIRDDS